MRWAIRAFTAATFLALSMTVFAVMKQPLLVMDMSNAPRLPRNFRTTTDTVHTVVNTEGLRGLHIAGGSQFSKMAFAKVLERLHERHIVIIDLRQESHGFLNGNAVSWYAPDNAINAGKTDAEIEEQQSKLLDQLSKQDVADVFDIIAKHKGYLSKVKAKQYAVHQVMSEQQFAESTGQQYARVYVQDTYAPSDAQVDRFIALTRELPKDKWIYFHCRAGVGRTTTFMAMYDMMHNAKKVSFEDILARQQAIGGKDLQANAKAAYKEARTKVRYHFLQRFYDYAKNNNDNFATSWTQWLNTPKTDNHE